jgi:hypothetical protein
MFNIIYFTEKIASMIATNFIAFSEIGRTISASETLRVEQGITNFPSLVSFGKN